MRIHHKIWSRILKSPLPGEVIRFGIVGMTATFIHAAIGYLLVERIQVTVQVANLLGFLSAWSISYIGHSQLSFRGHGQGKQAFFRFVIHSAAMFLMSLGIAMYLQSSLQINQSFMPVIAAFSIPLISLLSTKIFVFRKFKI